MTTGELASLVAAAVRHADKIGEPAEPEIFACLLANRSWFCRVREPGGLTVDSPYSMSASAGVTFPTRGIEPSLRFDT